MTSHRNARATLAAAFFADLSFTLPIWVIFGTNQLGLSTLATTALFMTIWFGSGLLEIPTGALADRLGRKKMFLIGAAMLAPYPLFYIARSPIWLIVVASIFAAFGSALRSGSLVALTNESYEQDKRSEKDYHAFLSNERTIAFIARAISGVTGGLLYVMNPSAPYVGIFVSYVMLFVSGLFTIDTAKERSTLTNRAHIGETIKAMMKKEIIVLLMFSYFMFQFVGEAMWTAYQPLFEADGVSPATIGVIFSVIAVVSALGSYSARFFMRRFGVLSIELMVSVAVLITAYMLFLPSDTLRLLAIIPSGFMFGIGVTPVIATTQKFVSTKLHSTALSVVSLLVYITYGFASIYIGFIIDRFGTEGTRKILLIEAIVAVVVLSLLYMNKRKKDIIITLKQII